MLGQGLTEDFYRQITDYIDDRLQAYARLYMVEIAELGTDGDGLPTARPSTPLDDPAIPRPFYPLIGSAEVGDWKLAITTGPGMVILGEASGGTGGPATNGLPTGGVQYDELQKNSGTNYDAVWITKHLASDANNGAAAITTYPIGGSEMPVTTASTGWPTASTAYNIWTVRTRSDTGWQWASLNGNQEMWFRRWIPGSSWGTWRRIAAYDANGNLTGPAGIILPEQATPTTPAADNINISAMDRGGRTELALYDSGGKIGVPNQDSWFVGKNVTAATMNRGTPMRLTGSAPTDEIPTVGRANASSGSGLVPAVGLLMDSGVVDNTYCRVMTEGLLTNIDTSAWAVGTAIYMDTTAGGLTSTPPVAPNWLQRIGTVTRSDALIGSIYVNPDADAVVPSTGGDPTGLTIADQASPSNPAADSSKLTVVDQRGKSVWSVYDSSGRVGGVMQDRIVVAQNASGGTVARGVPVRMVLYDGAVPAFNTTSADHSFGGLTTDIGLTMESSSSGGFARVMTYGVYAPFDTTAWTAGSRLFIGTGFGTLTTTEPKNPHYTAVIGRVIYSNVSGAIYVNPSTTLQRDNPYASAKVSTSNDVSTSTTLANVAGLNFDVPTAGLVYKFRAMIYYDAAATGTGARFVIGGLAMTSIVYNTTMPPATAGGTVPTTTQYRAVNQPAAATTVTPFTTDNLCVIEGVCVPSATGTVDVRFASEVAGSAITVKAGSSIEWFVAPA